VPFRLPVDWGTDPFHDRSWTNLLHKLRDLVDGALAAGDFAYARAVLRDWQRWHEGGRTTVSSWGDAVTGTRAPRLAYLLHATGWRDQARVRLAEEHAARLLNPDFLSTTNTALPSFMAWRPCASTASCAPAGQRPRPAQGWGARRFPDRSRTRTGSGRSAAVPSASSTAPRSSVRSRSTRPARRSPFAIASTHPRAPRRTGSASSTSRRISRRCWTEARWSRETRPQGAR
jgi:hypothetical protein